MNIVKLTLAGIALLGLMGCTSTIHKRFSIDRPSATSLSLDAKQRLFIVTDRGGPLGNARVTCAEPSPDAIMGIAASGALEASILDKGSAKVAASMAEAIGELGKRTPTIQLLRDALYRACEAYMNGVFGADHYKKMLYGYDDLVVTLLAIESLTQRNASPQMIFQAQTEARIANSAEARTVGAPEPAPGLNDVSVAPVSKEVAQVVKEILVEYYNLQKLLYRIEEPNPAGSDKNNKSCPETKSY